MGPRAGLDGCEKYRPTPGFDPRPSNIYIYIYIYIYISTAPNLAQPQTQIFHSKLESDESLVVSGYWLVDWESIPDRGGYFFFCYHVNRISIPPSPL